MAATMLMAGGLVLCALVACKDDPSVQAKPRPLARSQHRIEIVSPVTPALVAARRDEGGRWIRLEAVDGAYTLPELGERFTIVAVCEYSFAHRVDVHHWTSEDNPDLVISCIPKDGEELVEMKPRFAPGDVEQLVATGSSQESCKSTRGECWLRRGTRDAIVLYGTSFDSMRARIVRGFRAVEGVSFDADASTGWRPDRRMLELVSWWRGSDQWVSVCLQTRAGDRLFCSNERYPGELPERVEQEYIRVPNPARVATDCDLLQTTRLRMCLPDAPRTRVVIEKRSESPMRYDRAAHVLYFSSLHDADAIYVELLGRGLTSWNIIVSKHWLRDATQYAVVDVTAIPGWHAEWSFPAREIVSASLIWASKPALAPLAMWSPLLWQPMHDGDRVEWWESIVENGEDPKRWEVP